MRGAARWRSAAAGRGRTSGRRGGGEYLGSSCKPAYEEQTEWGPTSVRCPVRVIAGHRVPGPCGSVRITVPSQVCQTPHCRTLSTPIRYGSLASKATAQSHPHRPHRTLRTPRTRNHAGSRTPMSEPVTAPEVKHPHHRGQNRGPAAPHRGGHARGLRARRGEAARQGQADRPRADRPAARRGLLRRAGRVRPAPVHEFRHREEPPVRRRRRHRLRHGRRPSRLRLLAGLHDLRRLARRGLRREDRQGHGLRDEDRLPGHRHQRRRRRPDPGGRGRARAVRGDLPPQCARLRRGPADQPDRRSRARAARCTRPRSPTSR